MSEISRAEADELSGASEENYRELLIGCGRSRQKRVHVPNRAREGWHNLTTLDVNLEVNPDLWCDLNAPPPWHAWVPSQSHQVLPGTADKWEVRLLNRRHLGHSRLNSTMAHELLSDYWDEIHAYEVLEHLGSQGDAASYFAHFSEIYRLLKPGGHLCATVPSRYSSWLWGDPSHRRAILPESLVFLDQTEYVKQCDAKNPTSMSDFRHLYRADFEVVGTADNRTQMMFVLKAVKPSRWEMRKV